MNEDRISLTQDILVAYVDNELPPEQMAAVQAALAYDPAARDIVYRLRISARIAKTISFDALDEPVPANLVIAARGRRQPVAGRGHVRWLLPLAASILALAIGLGGGYIYRDQAGGYVAASAESVDPLVASFEATLQGALESGAAAGKSFAYDSPGVGQGKVTLGPSFTTSCNRDCRDFSREETRASTRSTGDGLACRAPDGSWSIMFFGGAL